MTVVNSRVRKAWLAAACFSLFVVIGAGAAAAPQSLTCRSYDGEPIAVLQIDLSAMTMAWDAVLEYRITGVTDGYLTGIESEKGVGGEVFVLDRRTGDYTRSMISLECADLPRCSRTILEPHVLRGRCSHPAA